MPLRSGPVTPQVSFHQDLDVALEVRESRVEDDRDQEEHAQLVQEEQPRVDADEDREDEDQRVVEEAAWVSERYP